MLDQHDSLAHAQLSAWVGVLSLAKTSTSLLVLADGGFMMGESGCVDHSVYVVYKWYSNCGPVTSCKNPHFDQRKCVVFLNAVHFNAKCLRGRNLKKFGDHWYVWRGLHYGIKRCTSPGVTAFLGLALHEGIYSKSVEGERTGSR